MKHIKNINCIGKFKKVLSLKSAYLLMHSILFCLIIGLNSCSDFVEVDPPKNLLISETVFDNPATVESVLANIFYKMREQGMVSGKFGLTTLMGIYCDELDYYGFDASYSELYHHNVTAPNTIVLSWWSNAYNLVYAANDIIAGVENSSALSTEELNRFKGQALFVRAYVHSLLVSIFGEVPYITTTDYIANGSVSRSPSNIVFNDIISDLTNAVSLLENAEASGERVLPNQSAAKALLARMYLYTENWELAEAISTELIDTHSLELDINSVFLKESPETLWQLKPGDSPRNTDEANELIIQFIPGQQYALTNTLLTAFEPGDLRLPNWTGEITNTDGTITLHFAHKYKATITETESLEYSIVFRLAEQYLIRAEARAQLGNLSGAQLDLNMIRNRAGLPNTTANSMNDLMDAVVQERRVELFAEQGHRWFDLKRTGNAGAFLSAVKPNWQATHVLLPIPETELELNPNLFPQNSGY
ncbi:MAG: RagB/SusD family nutrient uptake outer membrane protein [Lutibacter sp.]